ncbi:sulfite exporter TauE/SafE family protein [Granulosicoccus sp. 3-233]|uniref:sulfite exporter TauE/SafE family protein n=1 Tax=Granulosicoccus sp. 3-233 TaxID=3417969 RepID=UPI003D344089
MPGMTAFLFEGVSLESVFTPLLFSAVFIYFLAGAIKGMLGIGFPTAAVSLLAQIVDARTAILLVVIPMVVTNAWQVWRNRRVRWVFRSFWRLLLMMLIFIAIFSQLAGRVPVGLLTGVLGLIVAVYSLSSLYLPVLNIPDRHDRLSQFVAGSSAGVMGGLTGVWAPPLLIYLKARGVGKEAFVATTGVLLCLGSLVLFTGYASAGLIVGPLLVMSCLLLLPSLAGFSAGERIRRRLSPERFERLLLWFFLVMGLNLIRRALVGG